MKVLEWTIIYLFVISYLFDQVTTISKEEEKAKEFLKSVYKRRSNRENRLAVVTWNYENNVTSENMEFFLLVAEQVVQEAQADNRELQKYNTKEFTDFNLKRQFTKLLILETQALPPDKFKELIKNKYQIGSIVSHSKMCEFSGAKRCDRPPSFVQNMMASSRNANELKHYWLEWSKAIGTKFKKKLGTFVDLMSDAALCNHMRDTRDLWIHKYELSDIQEKVRRIWYQFQSLYEQFHAYVRYRLMEFYGSIVDENSPIPAHLLGSIYGSNWEGIFKIVSPYPNTSYINITWYLVNQSFTPLGLFKTADDFYSSMNFSTLPRMFWEKSLFEKPKDDRKVICQAGAWDFSDGIDFRIKHCAQPDKNSLFDAFRSLAHIQYFIQYRHQPKIFQKPTISAFADAVGGTVILSVGTTNRLFKIGFTKKVKPVGDEIMNQLFVNALSSLPMVAFSYVVDSWKWEVFSSKGDNMDRNCLWWSLMNEYMGIEPPVDRTEDDFDPIADYKFMSKEEFSIFISLVLQYQLHKALCIESGGYAPNDEGRPLYECDIYGSKSAGNTLVDAMRLGSFKPWMDILEIVAGQQSLDISPMLEYFEPLRKFLVDENNRVRARIGWGAPRKTCRFN